MAFLGIDNWKFLKPIYIGDTVYAKNIVIEKKETSKPDRGIVRYKRQLINQREEVVQEGETVIMVLRKKD
jgi:acyl dehydratase